MSLENLFQNDSSLTARRRVYGKSALNALMEQAAKDLANGLETREVIIPAISGIVVAYVPNSGQGHADRVREAVTEQIDSYMEKEAAA